MMKEAGFPDTLTVVNGPEDGAEFPITRAPFSIGQDATCAVGLRLDNTIQRVHARATSAADGYRIRGATGAPVYVNGKRAGMARSRILRSGDSLRIGYTDLVLECAPDGLASRSRGLVLESDLVWTLRRAFSTASDAMTGLVKLGVAVPVFAYRHWRLGAIVGAVALYFLFPPFHNFALNLIDTVTNIARNILNSLRQ